MGYTHYYDAKVPKDKWPELKKLINVVIKKTEARGIELDLQGPEDGKPPKGQVWLNGVGENAHETFAIGETSERDGNRPVPGYESFGFCKTAQKPYDVAVTAILALMSHLCPNMQVRSDGDPDEWKEGIELATEVAGFPIKVPPGVAKEDK